MSQFVCFRNVDWVQSGFSEKVALFFSLGNILQPDQSTHVQVQVCYLYININMGVSKNRGGPPQIIHFNKVFHYKPSILGGFPLFFGLTPIYNTIMI